MDIGSLIGLAVAGAGAVVAARKKREAGGSRKRSRDAAVRWKALLGSAVTSGSLEDLLSGRSLLTSGRGSGGGGQSGSGGARGGSGGRGGRSGGSRQSPGRRGPGAVGTRSGSGTQPPFRARRRPGVREMEREGVPHPLIVRRRRDRRKELLREIANVGMGSAAIGVSTAALMFDGGVDPSWSLTVGGLGAAVFGWILGREVLSDLFHLGS